MSSRGIGRHSILVLLMGVLLVAAPGSAQARAKPSCVVPNVKGDTLAAAKKRLTSDHCAVGTVKKAAGSGAAIVASQSPKAGLKEKNEDRVTLTMKLKPTVLSTTTTNPVTTTTPVTTTPALIPTGPLATVTIEAQNSTGTEYLLSAGLYYQPAGSAPVAIAGEPVTFSIIDTTTAQTVATFPGTSGASADCTIVDASDTTADTVTFTGEAVAPYAGCPLGSVTVPYLEATQLEVGVTFAGNSTYAASATTLSSEAPI